MHIKGMHDIKTHGTLARQGRLVRSCLTPVASLHRELFLENQVRLDQIEFIRGLLEEMSQAIAEGIPVVMQEFERLTKRLAELEAADRRCEELKR